MFIFLSFLVPVLVVSGIYHGIVGENGGIVDVTPEIRAENGPICGYRIVNTHKGKIPFEVRFSSNRYSNLVGEIIIMF